MFTFILSEDIYLSFYIFRFSFISSLPWRPLNLEVSFV